ncbi:unnamed protein product [Symbiodinium necroappetens]|uniref:Uncharacterized protein n=1 Tax=Symbiodinium necroappetens TaxID=1628268 RepID=A0A812Q9L5_9DINO|nr:unnamed protein product [Symbiodinium necroappetens]
MHSHPRHRRCAVGPSRTQQIWLGRMARWHFCTDLRSVPSHGTPTDASCLPRVVHSAKFIQCDLELCHPALPARAVHDCLVAGAADRDVFAKRFVQHCPSCWLAAA